MSRRLSPRAGAIRAVAAASPLATAALLGACSDPSSPREAGLPVGMYVLQSDPANPGVRVLAETVFVETPTTYRFAGLYDIRGNGQRYTRSSVRSVEFSADGRPILSGTSVSGPVRARRDTLVVYDPGYSEPDVFEAGRYVAAAPPPPAGPIASFVLTTADTMVRHGENIDLAPLVVRGLDATGRWIADPSYTVTAPTGWSASASVLTAPQRDEIGVARVTAGAATAEVRVHAVPDVTTRRWSLTFSCLDPFSPQYEHVADSVVFRLTVDSARYAPKSLPSIDGYPYVTGTNTRFAWAVAALHTSGTRTSWKRGVATESAYSATLPLIKQRGDALALAGPTVDTHAIPVPGTVLHRTEDAVRTYVAPAHDGAAGGVATWDRHFCRDLVSFRKSGPVRLTELP